MGLLHGDYFTKRGRGTEMAPLLILLMSTAFGMPSSGQHDVGAKIANQLEIFNNYSNEARKLFVNSSLIEDVVESLLGAEENLLQMEVGLKTLKYEVPKLRIDGNYFSDFNMAKSYVRQTRQGFREFAYKAVIELRDLKILIQDVGKSQDSILLKISLGKMKDLMIKTLNTLKEAEENYKHAVELFNGLNTSIKSKHEELEKMLNRDSYEYHAWEKIVNEVETEVCQNRSKDTKDRFNQLIKDGKNAVKEAIKKVDVLKVINTEPLCLDSVGEKVSDFEAELEKLKGITEGTLEKTKHFVENIMKAIDILTGETDHFETWSEKVKDVSQTIENNSKEYLREYETIGNSFIAGIDDLKLASEEFLTQPKDILYMTGQK